MSRLAVFLIVPALAFVAPAPSSGSGVAKDSSRGVQPTKKHFGVLRRAHRPFDRLPPDRRAYWRAQKERFGVKVGGARRTLDTPRGRVWLLPGAGFLCMDVEDTHLDLVVGGCIETWKARRGLLQLTQSLTSGKLILTGAVPDRTRHFRIVSDHHKPTPVQVRNNTYRVRFSAGEQSRWKPRKAVFLVGDNRHQFKLAGIRRR